MSEFLQSSPAPQEDRDDDYDYTGWRSNEFSDESDHDDREDAEPYEDDDNYYEDDYDDYEEEEDDDDYYDDYEEQHYGEERAEFKEEKLTLETIPLPKEILERYSFINELPPGIAVMGGVARSIAREIITGEREPIRDIDLVNIVDENGTSKVDPNTIDELSRKFMPDDYAFGYGVGNDTLDDYFKTRDFTINQNLIMDGKLIVSNFAYNDFKENIIRPTYFDHPYSGDSVDSRLFLKALMMRTVLSQISSSIPLIEDMEYPDSIYPFDVALFLNKAMSRGAKTARLFTEDLVDWDVIPEEYKDRPIALAKFLLEDVYSFEFRPSMDERFKNIQECDDMDGFFIPPSMMEYYAQDPVVRRAIAEYEDAPAKPSLDNGERSSGYYTQDEYDDINSSLIST